MTASVSAGHAPRRGSVLRPAHGCPPPRRLSASSDCIAASPFLYRARVALASFARAARSCSAFVSARVASARSPSTLREVVDLRGAREVGRGLVVERAARADLALAARELEGEPLLLLRELRVLFGERGEAPPRLEELRASRRAARSRARPAARRRSAACRATTAASAPTYAKKPGDGLAEEREARPGRPDRAARRISRTHLARGLGARSRGRGRAPA